MPAIVPARKSPRTRVRDVGAPAPCRPADGASEATASLATVLLLGCVVAVVFARSVGAPFVFDDRVSIVGNPSIVRLWPAIGDAERPGPLYPSRNRPTAGRPLVNLTFALNHRAGGLRPAGYHLANLALHVLAAALLASLVARTLRTGRFGDDVAGVAAPLGLVAALVWAVHPLVTDAVVYVTQRTEVLMACCYLATLRASLGYWSAASARTRRAWCLVATVACLAGMASKEVMVSAPLVVLLYQWTFVTRSLAEIRRSWPLYAGLALGWVPLVVLNVDAPRSGSAGFHHGVPAVVWWFSQAKVLFRYVALVVWPWPLSIHYAPAYVETLAAAWPWLVAVAILASGAAVLLWRRRAIGFIAVACGLILAPTALVPITTEMIAERRMYLPLAALAALVVPGAHRLLVRWRGAVGAWLFGVVAVATVVVLAMVTMRRIDAYATPVTLWQDAVARQPADAVAYDNLGTALVDEGRSAEAIERFRRALELEPGDSTAHNNLGALLTDLGRPDEAIEHLSRALALDPDQPKSRVYMNLGNALLRLGRADEAIGRLEHASRLAPDDADVQFNLAGALLAVGRAGDAVAHLERTVELRPDDAEAYDNLGSALLQRGESERAIASYRRALALRPDFAQAHGNLGAALAGLGRPDEAIAELREAVRLAPDGATVQFNLGQLLLDTGHAADAVGPLEEAVRLAPRQGLPRFRCAQAYARTGRAGDGAAMARTALDLARSDGETALATEIDSWLATPR